MFVFESSRGLHMLHCAGVVFRQDKNILLGKQRESGTWGSFGGRGGPLESPRQIAARECFEELRGAVAMDAIDRCLMGVAPLVSKTPSGARFFLYIAHMDSLEAIVSAFNDTRTERLPRCMQEISEVQVFHVDRLAAVHLRPSFRKELPRVIGQVRVPSPPHT